MNVVNINVSQESALQQSMNAALTSRKINAECVKVSVNKHLAFFDLQLIEGKASASDDLSKIRRSCEYFAMCIRSKTVPTVKVLSQEGIIRLQVSMKNAEIQALEDILRGHNYDPKAMLPFMLGESDEGSKVVVDFAKNPHTLIAGGTGSGKSVLLHNIIANCIYLDTFDVRNIDMYLVYPKQVEIVSYEDSMFSDTVKKVVNSYDDTVDLLMTIEEEMEWRYSVMRERGFRSLEENKSLFPQVVVVIDEVADLMIQDKKAKVFETLIVKLAQKARAAGIHLIMATQRPSVDVITGLIKANFPARIACKTSSKTDSQVILDTHGAENLMGRIVTGKP